jgi:hypothetical protein
MSVVNEKMFGAWNLEDVLACDEGDEIWPLTLCPLAAKRLKGSGLNRRLNLEEIFISNTASLLRITKEDAINAAACD